jgi:hypothetical protein
MEWMVRTELRLLQLFANILQGAENSPPKASFSATFSQAQRLGRLDISMLAHNVKTQRAFMISGVFSTWFDTTDVQLQFYKYRCRFCVGHGSV